MPFYRLTDTERALLANDLYDWQKHDLQSHVNRIGYQIGEWSNIGEWAGRIIETFVGPIASYDLLEGVTAETLPEALKNCLETTAHHVMYDLEETLQPWYEQDPEECLRNNPSCKVVDGKIQTPYQEELTTLGKLAEVLTPYTVWRIYDRVREAGINALDVSLLDFVYPETPDRTVTCACVDEFNRQINKFKALNGL